VSEFSWQFNIFKLSGHIEKEIKKKISQFFRFQNFLKIIFFSHIDGVGVRASENHSEKNFFIAKIKFP